jgi:hypothetical protein
VAQPQRLDPLLLPEGQCDEVPQLDELRVREMLVQPSPQLIVGRLGVEDDRFGIGQRCLFTLVVLGRVAEVEQFGVGVLGQSLLPGPDRALDPSVLAVNCLRDEDAAQLLDAVLQQPVLEGGIPGE